MSRRLRPLLLVMAFVAMLPLMAHLLEMPSKLTLGGPAWLAIQQTLYRGWGAVFGPVEIIDLLLAIAMAAGSQGAERRAAMLAVACYAGMIAVFFIFNDPVNRALAGWTAATLPADWPSYRLKWEIGHAISAVLSLIAFVAVLRPSFRRKGWTARLQPSQSGAAWGNK
ncbi:MAG: anthrone oxygenase family protein [Rhizomicrobium sp.]